jgi:SAM-dependent methyltransferase
LAERGSTSHSLARSFDRAATDYERGRPGWPPGVVDVVPLDSSATVVDLGAGTGKLTRLLAGRFARVIAVEPLDEMRALLQALVPEAEVLAGRAEEIPLPDDSADAVFVGEAFHWFDGKAAVTELARVLRPGGALVLMWNRAAAPTEPRLPEDVTREINRLFELAEHPIKGYEAGEWREAFESAPFEELRHAVFENPQRVDREGMVAFLASMSWISTLPEDERDALLELARSRLEADEYTRAWQAEVFWTKLRG